MSRRNTVRLLTVGGDLIRYVSVAEANEMIFSGEWETDNWIRTKRGKVPYSIRHIPQIPEKKEHVTTILSSTGMACSYAAVQYFDSMACAICGFSKATEQAHIIPARFGGPKSPENLLSLCPNHHTLFDAFRLSVGEMANIWPRVVEQYNAAVGDQRLNKLRARFIKLYGISLLPEMVKVDEEEHRSCLQPLGAISLGEAPASPN
jgi:hypothetical protein